MNKLEEHDKNFAGHDEKFDVLVRKLREHDKRFADHDGKFDILLRKTLEHDHEFVLVRKEIGELRQDMMRGQDEMLTILRRLDTESASTINRIKRVEAQCDQNTKDIAQHTSDISGIKRHTGMA